MDNVWEGAIAQYGCVQCQIYTGKHGVAERVLECSRSDKLFIAGVYDSNPIREKGVCVCVCVT